MIGNVLSSAQSIVVFLAVLSVLIIVHEWGHFITAKRLGVEVERFALGFGPALFSRKYRGTTYMINAIPLGGYVKMAGDERGECTGKESEFYSKPVGLRSLVVLNGPVVNFLLAYVTFVAVFMIGYPGRATVITGLDTGGPAQTAGLQENDKIISVNGKKIYGWFNLDKRLEGESARPIAVKVLRNGIEMTKIVEPEIATRPNLVGRLRTVRDLGIDNLPSIVGGLAPDYPAMDAGLQAGDRIIEVDGNPVTGWRSLQESIAESAGETIAIKFLRAGKELSVTVVPKIDRQPGRDGAEVFRRKIGIAPNEDLDYFRFGFKNSLVFSGEELWFITQLTYESLYRMVTGATSAKESVTGPVGIFYIVKGAAESGIVHVLYILGVISASLAIFNLLPVVPLDGGHLFLFGVERIRGKALSARADEYVARAGFALIILLAVFVFYSDFVRFGWLKGIGAFFGNLRKALP